MRPTTCAVLMLLCCLFWNHGLAGAGTDPNDAMQKLVAVYRTAPQGYPEGKDERGIPYAQPDTSVWFRWHFYNDEAVRRFEDAKMLAHVDPFNPLEGQGVSVGRGTVPTFSFVAEHVTEGKQALRVDFPAEAVRERREIRVKGVAGLPAIQLPTVCLGANYRWLKFDAFNSSAEDVHVLACGVPFVLAPGANVVTVKTADASGYLGDLANPGNFIAVTVAVTAPARDVSLFLDNVRVEQEVPDVISRKGRYLHFSAKGDGTWVTWPGASPLLEDTLYGPTQPFGWTEPPKTRRHSGLSFRSHECAVIWNRSLNPDVPFRIDVADGRWGIYVVANPVQGFDWSRGGTIKVNGEPHVLIPPRSKEELRLMAFGGEAWDFRPGSCVWEALVRPAYFPPTNVVWADATEGRLLLELPRAVAYRMLMVFPEKDKEEALREIGRVNLLMAESWDTAHPWVKGPDAERARYIGFHDEAAHPETLRGRLEALELTDEDFRRGFKLFHRGLTDAVYPDTVPTPEEAAVKELHGIAAPGERTWVTLGLLPLAECRNLQVRWQGLAAANGTRIPAAPGDVRVARYQQKCMEYGHHNHAYNYQEHYLVLRPKLDLYLGAARRTYVEIAVPPGTAAGRYTGRLSILSAEGQTLASVPVTLDVLPIGLKEPDVFRCVGGASPVLKDFGINVCSGDYDEAVKQGFKAFVHKPYFARTLYKGKDLGSQWGDFSRNKAALQEMCREGRAGKGPRAFFYGDQFGSSLLAEARAKPFFDGLLREIPELEVLNVNVPAFRNPAFQWGGGAPGAPEALKAARDAGKGFWFFDWVRYSKEQAARFSSGLWMWRIGATGLWMTFAAGGDFHYGTAKETYPWWPYYTLLGVVGGNYCGAVIESMEPGVMNPSRDLVLVAEGANDYRYVHTLESAISETEAAGKENTALASAKKFLEQLNAELSLDLSVYYETRFGAYAENWYPRKDNPWTGQKFSDTRRQCAEHIVALQRVLGP